MLGRALDNPAAALEALAAELKAGELHENLWESLHAAAARDGKEQELKAAYLLLTSERRLSQLPTPSQAALLAHAADFQQGILGDRAAAEALLFRVQRAQPGEKETFARLEKKLESAGDARGLIELYAIVAGKDARGASALVGKIVNKIVPLPASQPLSEEACKRVIALASSHPILFDVLEAHCRKGKRVDLACSLIEGALTDPSLPRAIELAERRRLVELYVVEAGKPVSSIAHVEHLLDEDPADELARGAAERLLANREVAARAAAALQKARRQTRSSDRQ
ncbi:MAG TPA: hypothetical protein VH062_34600 [Polyangiaceae bacterium]|jgi:hypothetical protein|nr:hypothetical protein [Polyangiaceae bacterium]